MNINFSMCIILFLSFSTHGRDMTKPPSIGLRTEVSYVTVMTLINKKTDNTDKAKLKFNLIKNIHNQSETDVVIVVKPELAKKLSINVDYIIAYQKLTKVRVNESKRYVPILTGPRLLNIEGANPAIFRFNLFMIEHFSLSPSLAKKDPQALLKSIFKGMSYKDSKVKEFFVREITNWAALHPHLKPTHFEQLYKAFVSPNASTGTRVAILEGRKKIHDMIGVERIATKTLEILSGTPVDIDMNSEVPSLILQALNYIEDNKLGSWNDVSRWTNTNVPTLLEKSLLMLAKIDKKKTLKLAKQHLKATYLHETSKRVFDRFIKSYRF